LHLAISSLNLKMIKMIIAENFEESLLASPSTLADMKGNFKQGLSKTLLL